MFCAIVIGNRNGSCSTTDTWSRNAFTCRSRRSCPSSITRPSHGSKNRGMSPANVVFPAPVGPMIAIVSPGNASKEMFLRTARVGSYPNVTSSNTTRPDERLTETAVARSASSGSASSTSHTRSTLALTV